MMTFFSVFLTILLVLDSLILGLLIIVQLPKKEAGVGVAFGGGAADALFGAGSGNALTKITKYTAGAFFVLVLILSTLNTNNRNRAGQDLRRQLEKQAEPARSPQHAPGSAAAPAAPVIPLTVGSNTVVAPVHASNAPAIPAK